MVLAQLRRVTITTRGPSGNFTPPDEGFAELRLEDHERVVHVEWKRGHEYRRRKTVDWECIVTVETRLAGGEAA